MASQGHKVDEDELADFGLYLGFEGNLTLRQIQRLATEEGLSAGGFTGLMSKLGETCQGPGVDAVDELFRLMQEKLCNLGDGLIAAAKRYGHDEEDNRSVLERTDGVYHANAYKRYLDESHKKPYPHATPTGPTSRPEPKVGGGAGGGGGSSSDGSAGESAQGGDSW